MSACTNYQPHRRNFVRLIPAPQPSFPARKTSNQLIPRWHDPSDFGKDSLTPTPLDGLAPLAGTCQAAACDSIRGEEIDSLYLMACLVEWRRRADPSSAWELISAANSGRDDTRAHARSLLEHSQRLEEEEHRYPEMGTECGQTKILATEASMKTPYGLEIIESCVSCKLIHNHFFCGFSPSVLRSVDMASHHSIMPAGAILFVEGQTPRGIYVLCSGKVKLSTTSKEGKVLILKQAEAGEALGLSATISGMNYEMTAETATPCQLNFISRTDLMTLLQCESEVGVHAAQWLSRDFQAAYRDIRNLVLARSSAGKLAKLLLSCAPADEPSTQIRQSEELRLRSTMTHEEMAQRIGSSRETVTRLLSDLKRKRLIRLEGATLVIRDRQGLEALAV
ncbi:MAG TPA: Crp/Fnr family transcriptional regulator [Candidatus Aquilonibacter sp.]|nr:Crp/Fnr family transcriptional regulator [Candidatus Aquilonibacter sp.]